MQGYKCFDTGGKFLAALSKAGHGGHSKLGLVCSRLHFSDHCTLANQRVLVTAGVAVVMRNVKLVGDASAAGAADSCADAADFRDGGKFQDGALLAVLLGGTFNGTNVEFRGGKAQRNGGGVASAGGFQVRPLLLPLSCVLLLCSVDPAAPQCIDCEFSGNVADASKGGGGALYVQAPSNRSGYYEYSLPLRSSGGSGRSKHPPFLQLSQAAGEGGGSFGHAAGSGGEQQHGKKPLVLTKELQEKIAEQVFTQGSLL